MMTPAGHLAKLLPGQRYLGDLAELAQRIPTGRVQRNCWLTAVAAARLRAVPRPGWEALFAKAMAFVATAHPELRQFSHPFFSQLLYEHPTTVAAVAVARPFDESLPFLWARLRSPELRGLSEMDYLLRRFKHEAGANVSQVARIQARCRWPRWVRRKAWWRDACLTARSRAKRLGTVAVASVGQHGGQWVDALYPTTTVLSYGTIGDDGYVDIELKFDARLITAVLAARILQDVERALTNEILRELRFFEQIDAA
jgi:hypothetical protein